MLLSARTDVKRRFGRFTAKYRSNCSYSIFESRRHHMANRQPNCSPIHEDNSFHSKSAVRHFGASLRASFRRCKYVSFFCIFLSHVHVPFFPFFYSPHLYSALALLISRSLHFSLVIFVSYSILFFIFFLERQEKYYRLTIKYQLE